MRVVLGEAYTDYMASRDAKVKQAHDRLQQQWAMALSSLRQSVAQLKAKAGFANQCLTEGARMVTNEGYKQSGVAPFCRECPEGYSYQPKNGDENEEYQLATVVGGLVCKPTGVPGDPVIPDPPPFVKPAWGLRPGTYAYTNQPGACELTLAGMTEVERSNFIDPKCGQFYPMLTTSALYEGQVDALDGCVPPANKDNVKGTVHEDGYDPKASNCYVCVQPEKGENVAGYKLQKADGSYVTCKDPPVLA